MPGDRFVVLGVARPRVEWFRSVARWATTAALPAEFVKCVSADEVRARLASGRVFSAALLDGGMAAVDRDLLDAVGAAGCASLVVDDGWGSADWASLGATAVLPATFSREGLLDALATHAPLVPRAEDAVPVAGRAVPEAAWGGHVALVCGPGGTGASTLAAGLAQGLAAGCRWGQPVLLADLCLRAEQAMLHDAGDVAPGVQELVDAHRVHELPVHEVRSLTFDVPARGYRLLLGLRRPHQWSSLRPRALRAAFEALRGAFAVTVCDVTADFEGEDEGGSADVEERNVMSRVAAGRADVALVVGQPGAKGLHALARTIGDLLAFGFPAERLQPVLNMAPRSPRERAILAAALGELAAPLGAPGRIPSPVFVPRRRVEDAVRDGTPLPAPIPALLAGAYGAVVDRVGYGRPGSSEPEPELVRPGSLGSWAEDPSSTEEAG